MIGYLGPAGTFSYEAAHKYLKDKKEQLCEFSSIYALIKAADKGEIVSAVVPIENSLEGSVNTTLDTLAFDSELYICGEYTMHIRENLMALPGARPESIKRIISHPQPIGQCAGMINKFFSDAVIEYTNSTAAAAKQIEETKDMTTATIGPAACAGLYGLEILMPEWNDEKNNALFAKYKELADGQDKVIFGGRLGMYKYFDMHQVIEVALECAEKELEA